MLKNKLLALLILATPFTAKSFNWTWENGLMVAGISLLGASCLYKTYDYFTYEDEETFVDNAKNLLREITSNYQKQLKAIDCFYQRKLNYDNALDAVADEVLSLGRGDEYASQLDKIIRELAWRQEWRPRAAVKDQDQIDDLIYQMEVAEQAFRKLRRFVINDFADAILLYAAVKYIEYKYTVELQKAKNSWGSIVDIDFSKDLAQCVLICNRSGYTKYPFKTYIDGIARDQRELLVAINKFSTLDHFKVLDTARKLHELLKYISRVVSADSRYVAEVEAYNFEMQERTERALRNLRIRT